MVHSFGTPGGPSLIISTLAAILTPSRLSGCPAEGRAGSVKTSRGGATDTVRFANRSEEEFAKILDFYGIRWEYEPRTFPLEWDDRGRPIESFNPYFYLPDYDLFIELTAIKQRLVTKKNRKVRPLRALYP